MEGAMLNCAICGTRKWQQMAAAAMDGLHRAGATLLHCNSCNRATYWLLSANESSGSPAAHPAAPSAGVPSLRTASSRFRADRRSETDRRGRLRRTHRRSAMSLPVRVRVSLPGKFIEETTQTVNVSKNGIYFHSAQPFEKGQPAFVALNYSPDDPASALDQRAVVVRVDLFPGTDLHGVAVEMK